VEARIVGLRRDHPGWGPSRFRWELERAGVVPLPGRSAVYRALVRQGLVEGKKRRHRREDYRRWERGRAMELWQMDVMGRVHLADGLEVKVVTGIDDHTRFSPRRTRRLRPGRWSGCTRRCGRSSSHPKTGCSPRSASGGRPPAERFRLADRSVTP